MVEVVFWIVIIAWIVGSFFIFCLTCQVETPEEYRQREIRLYTSFLLRNGQQELRERWLNKIEKLGKESLEHQNAWYYRLFYR